MRSLKFASALAGGRTHDERIAEPGSDDRDWRRFWRTECYSTAENGDVNRAFDVCTRALSNPDMSVRDRAATYVNRSVVRMRVRDYNGAIADCDQSIQRWPDLSEPHVNRGAALINLERPRDALTELDLAINRGLDKVHLAYYNRGLAKEMINDAGRLSDRKAPTDPTFTLASEQLTRFLINGMRARS